VLERHLKQTETIYPFTVELGKFKGEPVYPRSAVVSLKSAENWMRTAGRTIKEGEQAMKTVKVRSSTVNKMRELETLVAAAADSTSSAEITHGLYAYSQTESYVPDAVVDVNNFLNSLIVVD
jgi:xeroderma pigmentosum group C-complementing protein